MGAVVRILIVDDEELIRRTLRRALPEHDVDLAESGAEALALHRAAPYDLGLLDFYLPDTNGPRLARGLLALAPLRIVLMGGGDLEPYRLVGAEILCKPFSHDELRACLARDDPAAREFWQPAYTTD
jgi:DNA-binding response OmpR family regulator